MDEGKYSYQDIAFYCKEICDLLNAKLDDGNPVYFSQIYTFCMRSEFYQLSHQMLNSLDTLLQILVTQEDKKQSFLDTFVETQDRLHLLFLLVRIYILKDVLQNRYSAEKYHGIHRLFVQEEVRLLIRSYIDKEWKETIQYWIKNCCNGKFTKDKINLSFIMYSK